MILHLLPCSSYFGRCLSGRSEVFRACGDLGPAIKEGVLSVLRPTTPGEQRPLKWHSGGLRGGFVGLLLWNQFGGGASRVSTARGLVGDMPWDAGCFRKGYSRPSSKRRSSRSKSWSSSSSSSGRSSAATGSRGRVVVVVIAKGEEQKSCSRHGPALEEVWSCCLW